jgi:hypothetical protein
MKTGNYEQSRDPTKNTDFHYKNERSIEKTFVVYS